MHIQNNELTQKIFLDDIKSFFKDLEKRYVFEHDLSKIESMLDACYKNICKPGKAHYVLDKEKSKGDLIVGTLYYTPPEYIEINFTITNEGEIIHENK